MSAVKKIEANPINIAVILIQESDTSKMASSLDYYGYLRQTPIDGYAIFTHSNGSMIRYKMTNQDINTPVVEVKTKTTSKERDKILKNLNFQKTGLGYERKSIGITTHCSTSPNGILVITREHTPRQ